MGDRKFAQVNCSILGSVKLKLCDHKAKWVYLCTHFSPLGNFMGVFHYPLVMWAQDAGMCVDDLLADIVCLEEVGLVHFDHEHEIVRIIGFHRQRPPENAKHMIGLLRDFKKVVFGRRTCPPIWISAITEFVVACIERKQLWAPDSKSHTELSVELEPFLRMAWDELGDPFLEALNMELADARPPVRKEFENALPFIGAPTSPAQIGNNSDGSDLPF